MITPASPADGHPSCGDGGRSASRHGNFTWILKDKLAICERPGGYGDNHRRVRRQEEIIWIRENGFGCVISIIPAPHNLHNYDELGVTSRHRPFNGEDLDAVAEVLLPRAARAARRPTSR